jgi:hypothetical protein
MSVQPTTIPAFMTPKKPAHLPVALRPPLMRFRDEKIASGSLPPAATTIS